MNSTWVEHSAIVEQVVNLLFKLSASIQGLNAICLHFVVKNRATAFACQMNMFYFSKFQLKNSGVLSSNRLCVAFNIDHLTHSKIKRFPSIPFCKINETKNPNLTDVDIFSVNFVLNLLFFNGLLKKVFFYVSVFSDFRFKTFWHSNELGAITMF